MNEKLRIVASNSDATIGKSNCFNTFERYIDGVERCKGLLIKGNLAASYAVIVLVNADDVHGSEESFNRVVLGLWIFNLLGLSLRPSQERPQLVGASAPVDHGFLISSVYLVGMTNSENDFAIVFVIHTAQKLPYLASITSVDVPSR